MLDIFLIWQNNSDHTIFDNQENMHAHNNKILSDKM